MICPACKTNNSNPNTEHCVQCGADLHVHQLLQDVRKTLHVSNNMTNREPILPQKTSTLVVVSQVVPSLLLLACALFGMFIGMRFLAFIDRADTHRSSIATKWSETGFDQLQQMNMTIKQELDLILDQRRENLSLQATVHALTKTLATAQKTPQTMAEAESKLSSFVQGWKE